MQPIEMELWKAKDVARLLSLVESDRRYFQEMVASIPTAFAVVSDDLVLSSGNRAFRQLFGGRTADVVGSLDQTLPSPDILAAVRHVLAEKKSTTATTKIGEQEFAVSLQPIRHWDGEEVLVTLSPIAPPQPQTTPSPLAMAIWTVDAATMRFTAMDCGALPSEEWQAGADFWSRKIAPSDLASVREFYQSVVADKPISSCDYQAQTADGGVVWLRDVVHAEKDADGKVERIRGMSIDVTEARSADAQRYQAHRLDALSRLANRVVHDCNNLVMIMGGYGEDLLQALPPESSLRVNVQEILAAGDRLATFTRQLGAFTKRSPASIASFGLDPFLAELKADLEKHVPTGIDLAVSGNTANTLVSTDAQQLASAIQTLVDRAAVNLPNGGSITIHSALGSIRHVSTGTPAGLPPGPCARISIRDSGMAIHPDTLARLFEPDASTDPIRQRLPAVYRTLRSIGCDLEVSSIATHGSSFQIVLPLGSVDKQASAPPPVEEPEPPVIKVKPAEPEPPPPPVVEKPKPVVLVVDDEAGIRSLLRRVLLRDGYQVLEATQGREGIEVAAAHKGDIDLLLSDVVMPEMGGIELAHKLHATRPGTKILLISGYMGAKGMETEDLPRGTMFLQKPFTLNSLLEKVKETLGTATAR